MAQRIYWVPHTICFLGCAHCHNDSALAGQRVTVFPDLDMIVVFTGGNYVERDPVDEITVRYILPAVR